MQTDWLEKALQLNITIIIFKEVVNGYDPFSTIFLMLLQTVKVTFILSHLRKPFSIWSIFSFSSNSSSYLLYTFIVLVLSLRKILVPVSSSSSETKYSSSSSSSSRTGTQIKNC